MGKAIILTCDQGRASIQYDRLNAFLDAQIAQFDEDLAKIDARIVMLEAEILDFEDALEDAVAVIDGMVSGYASCVAQYGPKPAANTKPTPPPWPCEGMAKNIAEAQKRVAEESAKLYAAKQQRDDMKAEKSAIDAKYIIYQAERNDDLGLMDVWVADWTDGNENPEPASVTGTIEVWGMFRGPDDVMFPRSEVILAPQYSPELRKYSADGRDFGITGPMNSEAARVFDMIATWAWVQEHRPRYIIGRALEVNYEAQTIRIRREIPFGLDAIPGVDYTFEADCNVIYRDCGAFAFRVGDRVVVEFSAPNKQGGWVVGFERDPRKCEFYGWIVGISPVIGNHTGKGALRVEGEWVSAGNTPGGNVSWWDNTGQVVTWFGSPQRYWGTTLASGAWGTSYVGAWESNSVFYRGTFTATDTQYGWVKGAAARIISGETWLFAITADRTNRRDCLLKRNHSASGAWELVGEQAWLSAELTEQSGGQAHVVAFNASCTAAVTLRQHTGTGNNLGARIVSYSIGEAEFGRSVASYTGGIHTTLDEVIDQVSAYREDAYRMIAAVDYDGDAMVTMTVESESIQSLTAIGGGVLAGVNDTTVRYKRDGVTFFDFAPIRLDASDGIGSTTRVATAETLFARHIDLRCSDPLLSYRLHSEDTDIVGTYRRVLSDTHVLSGYGSIQEESPPGVNGDDLDWQSTWANFDDPPRSWATFTKEEYPSFWGSLSQAMQWDTSGTVLTVVGNPSQSTYTWYGSCITGPQGNWIGAARLSDSATWIEHCSNLEVSTLKTVVGFSPNADIDRVSVF